MKLTSHLPDDRRAHVEGRLRANLMAWLTTVRPDGRPDSVPVWFLLRDDETILTYSQAGKIKLRNISHNPRVALGLDVTDLGRDIVRIEGTAERVPGFPTADQVPEYVVKYAERIGAMVRDGSPVCRALPGGSDHHAAPPLRLTASRRGGWLPVCVVRTFASDLGRACA